MESLLQQIQELPPWAVDILRLSIWLMLLMLIFVPLERAFALHRQKIFRKSIFTDLGYYYLNGLLPKLVMVFPVAAIAWLMRRIVPAAVHSWSAGLPLSARLVAALVAGELGYYWGHRWAHEIPLLWRFHSIHHSAEEMDWMVSSRAHPVDFIFVRLCGFVPLYALGLAQPTVGYHLDTVPLLILLLGTMWGFFIHANLRWRLSWLSFLIATPAFHHWHHTNDEHTDKNYASMLPIMDILFGSWYLPKQWPAIYGIKSRTAPSLSGQLAQPFLPTALNQEDDPS
jgi:sterol desaturase/sphingolipid hydroxylase (fatty acid hydroxylase superfamily)